MSTRAALRLGRTHRLASGLLRARRRTCRTWQKLGRHNRWTALHHSVFRVGLTYCIESGTAASMFLLAEFVARSSPRGQICGAFTRQAVSIQSNVWTAWVRFVLVVYAARPLASSFSVLPVVRPLACLTHNVSGICARAETAAGSAAGGCAAAFAAEGRGAICCCWFVFCCFGCGGGPKDIHHHKSGRVQGANFPLFGRPLDPGRIGFGVHLGVPQASAGSEAAPADTLADVQIGLQMMLQVFVIRTVSTRHGTAMDTQLLTEPLNNGRTVAR